MAIYQSISLIPSNTTTTVIDGTELNVFSFMCQGTTITKYNATIYKLSDNSVVYTTGDVPLSPVGYNGDTVSFNVPINTLTNGTQYKWNVTTYENASSITSFTATFWANAKATISMTIPSTISAQSYNFTATYVQTDNVPISYFYFVLSDSTGIIKQTDLTFSGNVKTTFSGFVDDNSYTVQVFGMTSNGYMFNSPVYMFNVNYPQPSISIVPTVIQNCKTSIVDIKWGGVVVIGGSVIGAYSYIQNYGLSNNWALSLGDTSYYSSDFEIPETFSYRMSYKPIDFTSGKMVSFQSTEGTKMYEFGYDSTYSRFYVNINGSYGYSQILPLPTTDFMVFLNPLDAYVRIDNILYQIIAQ